MSKEKSTTVQRYGIYILVWLALVILTSLTVTVAGFALHHVAVVSAMTIATTKTLLVLNFFMHLRNESRLLKIMVTIAVIILAVFVGLTFFDVLFR